MKNTCKLIRNCSVIIAFIACLVNAGAQAQPQQQGVQNNALLYWANKLQPNINQQNTSYQHKDNVLSWGDDGNPIQCYADCSGFISALIAKSLRWTADDFKTTFGHKRMYAYHYFDAITSGNHFQQIKNIDNIQPGDIIALKYADRSEHEDNTGHVMLIAASPRPHRPSKVLEPHTRQYEIEVIDCSKSPHGKNDSRSLPGGGGYSGLGRGTFRLYTDEQGNIVAYSWSIVNPKEGFNPMENPIVVGRFSITN